MGEAPNSEACKRSVDNLQRLYTVVVSLAVTEFLRRLLLSASGSPRSPSLGEALMFSSFIITIVPFYHGANRYLDATYVTGERKAKSYGLMLDFVALFIEGTVFFALAFYTADAGRFYTILACLLVGDSLWVKTTRLTAEDETGLPGQFQRWFAVNLVAACLIFIFVWSTVFNHPFWVNATAQGIALFVVALVRTVGDYWSVWDFYFPETRLTADPASQSLGGN